MSIDLLYQVQLPEWIYWRVPLNGVNEAALSALPGWHLITPIGAARMGEPVELITHLGNDVLISQASLSLRYEGEISPMEVPIEIVTRALALIRYVSGQSTVPRRVLSIGRFEARPYASGPHSLSSGAKGGRVAVWDYALHNAITEAHLQRLGELSPGDGIPVHAEVLLDALEAHRDQDFRKALLYAAIALEAYAADKLESVYSEVLRVPSAIHRVVTRPVRGDAVVTKDPIYEVLSLGDNFGRLLHERPLYLSGRSLLIDDPDTYRRALQLYTTRNKIAHRGQPPPGENYFPTSKEGSFEGLSAAIDAFRWLGDSSSYCIPMTMVTAEDGKPLGTR